MVTRGLFRRIPFNVYIGVVVLVVYFPSYFNSFLWSDDYPSLTDPAAHRNHAIRDARPIYGLLLSIGFASVKNDVDHIVFLRLLSVIGIYLLIILIQKELKGLIHKELLLPCLIVAFCTSSWLNIIYFATTFVYPWACLSALAGVRWIGSDSRKKHFGGILLICVSSLIYPLATLFPLSITYIRGILESKNAITVFVDCLRKFILLTSITLGSLLTSGLVTSKIFDVQLNPRVDLVSPDRLGEKATFFTTRLLGQSIRFFSLTSSSSTFIVGFVMILAFFYIFFRYCKTSTHLGAVSHIATLLLVFTMLLIPFAAVSENQIDIRYFIGTNWLSSMIIAIMILEVRKKSIIKSMITVEHRGLFSLAMITLSIVLSINFYQGIVRPISVNTQTFIGDQLSDFKFDNCQNKVLVFSREDAWPTRELIGMASQLTDLSSTWVPIPATELYFKEKYNRIPKIEYSKDISQARDSCDLDLGKFKLKDSIGD
jgi:hypothetical protein